MCKTVLEVRYFDLYVIGSEGCHLCLPCELQVVEMVRQAAGQALEKKTINLPLPLFIEDLETKGYAVIEQ